MVWKEPPRHRTPTELILHNRILTWELNPHDNVLIVGGYQGTVCALMLERYPDIELYTWEPQPDMYGVMVRRFAGMRNVHIRNSGLGERDGRFPMKNAGSDACSFLLFPGDKTNLYANLAEFTSEMVSLDITHIAFLHLNIEGYEYNLLPHIITQGWMDHIDQMVVSTHGIRPEWDNIIEQIERTHTRLWTDKGYWGWSKLDAYT